MHEPTQAHRAMERLAGSWIGEETMLPSPWVPEATRATGHITYRVDLDGFFLLADYRQENEGEVTYRGHGVYTYDAAKERYLMWWFDTMSPVPGTPAEGVWDGNRLTFEGQNPDGGASRYTYEFHDDETLTLGIHASPDGESWTPFLDALYRRA